MEPHPFAREMQEAMIAEIERAQPRFIVLVNVDTSWSRRPDSSTRLFDWVAKTVDERWDTDARDARPRSSSYVVTFERRS